MKNNEEVNISIESLKNHCAQLDAWFRDLNTEIGNIKYMLEDLTDGFSARIKIPHRCPVCNGAGIDSEGVICQTCESRGIVWG